MESRAPPRMEPSAGVPISLKPTRFAVGTGARRTHSEQGGGRGTFSARGLLRLKLAPVRDSARSVGFGFFKIVLGWQLSWKPLWSQVQILAVHRRVQSRGSLWHATEVLLQIRPPHSNCRDRGGRQSSGSCGRSARAPYRRGLPAIISGDTGEWRSRAGTQSRRR